MYQITKNLLFLLLLVPNYVFGNFPTYFEMNIGETIQAEGYPSITLLSKRIALYDSSFQRIGASEVTLIVDDETVTIPVGYENSDVTIKNVRIGVEGISDYEKEFKNNRFHLLKDVRIRISRAGETLMPQGTHVYPLFTPWNSGFRTQGWLTVCINIDILEGKAENKAERYHDGWDFGTWEGQLVRSVCTGIVVSPDEYPEFIDKDLLYNKNGAPVGPNPFLVKEPDLPILYYYTHLSGLTRNFEVGEIIQKGEPLGYASARGSSGGWYHLHFSMIHLEKEKHLNPFPFIKEWYEESLPHYQDFMTDFEVYYYQDNSIAKNQFEQNVVAGKVTSTGLFKNSMSGMIHVREAVAESPFAGLNHVVFNQFAALKGQFQCDTEMSGELWFGHTGNARLFLNGELIYNGENQNQYSKSAQPFQWDSLMFESKFRKGLNEVVIAIEQTNPFWSFSIRPRNRLGMPLK